jgi:exopolyphosphatase/guanosine-5'-triphosphate,3'-diphosphate pyrophosphatase
MIVPRWEWRTFGATFGEAEEQLTSLEPARVSESDESYVVSSRGEGSVKVRGGQLDVKRLEQVNDDGLEQWRPVAKAEFPIAAAEVASLLTELGAAAPLLRRDAYELDELVDEVVSETADLLAVRVQKRRTHYVVDGCAAELTEVRTGAHATRTIAVEDEDPALVRATVKALGLWSRPNVSFPRGLMALVGFGAHTYAVLDIGTSSVKFHVGEQAADRTWRRLVDRAEVTRLGQGLDNSGRLQPEPMERTIDAIAEMAEEARAHGAEAIAAVGTAGLRAAANSADFVDAVRARSGIEVEVISGAEEARLSYLAASGLGRRDGSLVVFETGGGSTQFTFGHRDRVDEQFSVDVGAVRFTERFALDGVVDEPTLAAALEAIAEELRSLDGRPVPDVLVGMGGAVTNLAAVKHELATYDGELVQGTVLELGELDRQIESFRTRSAVERRAIAGLQPKRAEIILAGACVVRTVLAKLGRESLVVSDRGLRHRLLVERFGS